MIPEADTVLNGTAMKLMLEIAPTMPPGYSQGSLGTAAIALVLAAQEYPRAAAVRLWENAAMEGLLGQAVQTLGDPALKARIGEALKAGAAGADLPALNARNAALKGILAEAHAAAAGMGSDGRALDRAILTFLAESAQRRLFVLPPF